MLEICNYAEPTSQTNDFNNFTLAICEIGDGYSQENVDHPWPENLYARADKIFHEMGRSRSVLPS